MTVPLNFDANTVEPRSALDPIPAGWYPVKIVESSAAPTADQTGSYLKLEMEVIGGEYAGRKLFDRLNLQNKNPVAVEIAYRTLSSICHATGVMQVQQSSQLHGIPLEVKVSLRPAEGQYEASNDVKGYRRAENLTAPATPTPALTPPGAAPAAPPAGGTAPPATPAPPAAPAFSPPPAAPAPPAAPTPPGGTGAPPTTTPPWAT